MKHSGGSTKCPATIAFTCNSTVCPEGRDPFGKLMCKPYSGQFNVHSSSPVRVKTVSSTTYMSSKQKINRYNYQ